MNPQQGQIARVRTRKYLIEDVVPPATGDLTLVRLACLEDDARPPHPSVRADFPRLVVDGEREGYFVRNVLDVATRKNTRIDIAVLANDRDVDDDTIRIVSVTKPVNGDRPGATSLVVRVFATPSGTVRAETTLPRSGSP